MTICVRVLEEIAGAQTFIVPNTPDLAVLPVLSGQPAAVRAAATMLAGQFNDGLESLLAGLEATAGITIVRLDVFALINAAVEDPTAAGLDDAATPCIRFGVRQQPFCTQPDRHLFWDAIHPTRAGHRLLARAAHAALTGP